MTLEEKKEHFTKWFNLWVEGVDIEYKTVEGDWRAFDSVKETKRVPTFLIRYELRIKPRVFEIGRYYPIVKDDIKVIGCWSGNLFRIQGGDRYYTRYERDLDWIGEALPEDLWESTT